MPLVMFLPAATLQQAHEARLDSAVLLIAMFLWCLWHEIALRRRTRLGQIRDCESVDEMLTGARPRSPETAI